jgi:hypothetical protein
MSATDGHINTNTGAVVAQNGLSHYAGGVCLVYNYTGNMTFRIENMSHPSRPQ